MIRLGLSGKTASDMGHLPQSGPGGMIEVLDAMPVNLVCNSQDGWRERVALHQMHIIMIHCAVFGRSYVPEAAAIARRYV